MNIYVNTCWHDEAEVAEFVKLAKEEYNVKATFNDESVWYSTWKLEGEKSNLLKLLEEKFDDKDQNDAEDAIEDEDDFIALFG